MTFVQGSVLAIQGLQRYLLLTHARVIDFAKSAVG
jgi:hypothetical protein